MISFNWLCRNSDTDIDWLWCWRSTVLLLGIVSPGTNIWGEITHDIIFFRLLLLLEHLSCWNIFHVCPSSVCWSIGCIYRGSNASCTPHCTRLQVHHIAFYSVLYPILLLEPPCVSVRVRCPSNADHTKNTRVQQIRCRTVKEDLMQCHRLNSDCICTSFCLDAMCKLHNMLRTHYPS